MTTSWKPLLEGDAAARAWEAIDALSREILVKPGWLPESLAENTATTWRASVASGAAGQSLFFTYLALHRDRMGEKEEGEADAAETALELLDRATEAIADVPMTDSLYTGFTGIAWANEHLRGRLFESEDEESNEIDETLLQALDAPRPNGEYDLINGLVGLGIYALEALPRPSAARCLEKVVERLAERAERGPEGAAWYSPPERMPTFQVDNYPLGLYNLGASHGMAGVIALLGAACRAGVATETARPLLEEAVAWLLRRRQPGDRGFCFPHFYHPDIEPGPSRLAWCYGDPGVAVTLLVAARGAGEPEWERAAIETALSSATRPEELARIRDAGLCHGALGLAHLFNRMYQASGEETLAEAARSWYEWALGFRKPGSGVGGFQSWTAETAENAEKWRDDPGFLEGASGIGLALLAAVSPVDPEWDRLLLVGSVNPKEDANEEA